MTTKFLISNFNTVPRNLFSYTNDYLVFDQSNDVEVICELEALKDNRIVKTEHVGHNLLDYINFFISNYHSLPERMALIKGNIIGRHIDLQGFDKALELGCFSPLYRDRFAMEIRGTQYFPTPSLMAEVNNNWYVSKSTHKYFTSFDDFMHFFFEDYTSRKFVLFAPGACYLIERERVKNYPLTFWMTLRQVLNYGFFPSEAWIAERAFYYIFTGQFKLRDEFFSSAEASQMIANLPDKTLIYIPSPGPLSFLRKLLHYLKPQLMSRH